MNKKKTMTALIIVLAVLFIGIGYAAISNVTLNITGNAKVEPGANAFDVNYKNTNKTVSSETITGQPSDGFTITTDNTHANYTALKTATITATEFTQKDQYVDFTFTVQNDSAELKATLTNANISLPTATDYFEATVVGTVNLNLAPGATGDFTVRVKCKKTPTAAQTWDNFVITITPQAAEA